MQVQFKNLSESKTTCIMSSTDPGHLVIEERPPSLWWNYDWPVNVCRVEWCELYVVKIYFFPSHSSQVLDAR